MESQHTQSLLESGRERLRSGSPGPALALFWQVLALAPAHADAAHLAGLSLVALGRLEEALLQLQSAVLLAPALAAPRHNLGRVCLQLGRNEAALQAFDDAWRCDPSHLLSGMQRAGVLEAMGRAKEAASAFTEVAQRHPLHALAHSGAARQLYRVDDLDAAIAAQERALAIDLTLLRDGRIGCARASADKPSAAEMRATAARTARLCSLSPGVDAQAAVLARELLVIDGFLPDPLAARSLALALPRAGGPADASVNYPGSQTGGGHADALLLQRIVDAIGRDLKWGWPAHGAFRFSPRAAAARSDIHADHDDARPAYAGVLYLSLPEHCRGGTVFWTHRETGWDRMPTPAQAAASQYGSVAAFLIRNRHAHARDFDAFADERLLWDRVLQVPMRFNRLLLYRSDHFHSIAEIFGSTPQDSRLVQLFFFEPMGAGCGE